MNNFEKIRQKVREIPMGKVSTYGEVAKAAGVNDARQTGWAIYNNQDTSVPCHRVVKKDGGLAENFSLGGWEEQRRRLEVDGIEFTKEKTVDLDKYLHTF